MIAKIYDTEIKVEYNHKEGFNRYSSDIMAEYNQSIEEGLDIEKQKAELLKKAQVITETAITIKLKFPNMPELFDKEIEKADELNKECGKLDNEIKKYKEQIGILESQFNALLSLNNEEYLEEIDFEHKDGVLYFEETEILERLEINL